MDLISNYLKQLENREKEYGRFPGINDLLMKIIRVMTWFLLNRWRSPGTRWSIVIIIQEFKGKNPYNTIYVRHSQQERLGHSQIYTTIKCPSSDVFYV